MLTLTENASAIVAQITDQIPDADAAGLRLSPDPVEGGLAVSAVPLPEPGDQVVEQGGAKVYLADEAAVVLDDQVLDAAIDEAGAVRFSLAPQA